MHLWILVALLWIHWFADFYCQNDKMAINKSKHVNWLLLHCGIYGLFMGIFGWEFTLINTFAHFVIDYNSSRLTTKFHISGDRHNFFVVIGADQALHLSILVISARYLGII